MINSNEPKYRIGKEAVRHGLLAPDVFEQLCAAYHNSRPTLPFDVFLVARQYLTPAQVAALRQAIQNPGLAPTATIPSIPQAGPAVQAAPAAAGIPIAPGKPSAPEIPAVPEIPAPLETADRPPEDETRHYEAQDLVFAENNNEIRLKNPDIPNGPLLEPSEYYPPDASAEQNAASIENGWAAPDAREEALPGLDAGLQQATDSFFAEVETSAADQAFTDMPQEYYPENAAPAGTGLDSSQPGRETGAVEEPALDYPATEAAAADDIPAGYENPVAQEVSAPRLMEAPGEDTAWPPETTAAGFPAPVGPVMMEGSEPADLPVAEAAEWPAESPADGMPAFIPRETDEGSEPADLPVPDETAWDPEAAADVLPEFIEQAPIEWSDPPELPVAEAVSQETPEGSEPAEMAPPEAVAWSPEETVDESAEVIAEAVIEGSEPVDLPVAEPVEAPLPEETAGMPDTAADELPAPPAEETLEGSEPADMPEDDLAVREASSPAAGLLKVEIALNNWLNRFLPPEQHSSPVMCEAVIATGTTDLALPADIIEALQLTCIGEAVICTADGIRHPSRLFGMAELTIQGRTCQVRVVELPSGAEPLVGIIPLELMDWQISLREKKLVANPDSEGPVIYLY